VETVQGQAQAINEIPLPSIDANTTRLSSANDYESTRAGEKLAENILENPSARSVPNRRLTRITRHNIRTG
jgi:hypothetical protein